MMTSPTADRIVSRLTRTVTAPFTVWLRTTWDQTLNGVSVMP